MSFIFPKIFFKPPRSIFQTNSKHGRVRNYSLVSKRRTFRKVNDILFNFYFSSATYFSPTSLEISKQFILDFYHFFLVLRKSFFFPLKRSPTNAYSQLNRENLFNTFSKSALHFSSYFGNYLGKFLFWHYRNRIFFLNRRFLFNLKYIFAELKDFDGGDSSFSSAQLNHYFLAQTSSTVKFLTLSLNKSKQHTALRRKKVIFAALDNFYDSRLHSRLFDFFRNPYALTPPPNSFLSTFDQSIFAPAFGLNFKQICTQFLVKYKHLQWPIILTNYNLIFPSSQNIVLKQVEPMERLFLNKNDLTNTFSLFWLMSHFLNFNICILSLVRGRMFFSITTARGYVLLRRSQAQFCPISTPKLYKEPAFKQVVSEKFSYLCSTLNFLGLVYFLKNGLNNHKLVQIFKLMAIKFQFKIRVRGIIIGRSLPHSLPGRFRKRRRY